jgi:hypothetical protein
MHLTGKHRLTNRGWQGVVIVLAVCSLTLCVATRFWAPDSTQPHVLKSADNRPAEPSQQHLDRDATQWIAPSADFSFIELPAVENSAAVYAAPLPTQLFSDSLYNRPPPSADLSL